MERRRKKTVHLFDTEDQAKRYATLLITFGDAAVISYLCDLDKWQVTRYRYVDFS